MSWREHDFSPENRDRLDAFFASADLRGRVACFDLDGTCLRHDAGEAVFYAMAHQRRFQAATLLNAEEIWLPFVRYRLRSPRSELEACAAGQIDGQTLFRAMLRAYVDLLDYAGKSDAERWLGLLLAGQTPDEVRDFSRAVIERQLNVPLGRENPFPVEDPAVSIPTGLRAYAAMGRLMQRLQAAGAECWLVSASNRYTVEAWAERFLPVPPERIIAVSPRESAGRLQAGLDPELPMTYGQGKVAAMEKLIGERPVLAAGNSINDLPMLQQATALRLVIDGGPELRRRADALAKRDPTSWIFQPAFWSLP